MKELKSNFAELIKEFIEQKVNLGYKYTEQAKILREFDLYCVVNFPDTVYLTKN